MKYLENWHFPHYAKRYFSHGMKDWSFVSVGEDEYAILQTTPAGELKVAARCSANTAIEAKSIFCKIARGV